MDLKPFCGESQRFSIAEPWVRDGWRYATDGRMCIRVPAPGEPDTVRENLVGRFEYFEPQYGKEVQAKQPWTAVEILKREVDCEACSETADCEGCGKPVLPGKVHVYYANKESCAEHICDDCDGKTKYTRYWVVPLLKAPPVLLAGRQAEKLNGLSGVTYQIVAKNPLTLVRFSFACDSGQASVRGMGVVAAIEFSFIRQQMDELNAEQRRRADLAREAAATGPASAALFDNADAKPGHAS